MGGLFMANNSKKYADNTIIQSFADKIKEKFHPQKIILFGSYAYGMPNESSDLDFFIIMKTNLKTYKQAALIRQTLDESFGVNFPIDIVVKTPAEIEQRIEDGDFFITKIVKEGVAL